MKCLILILAFVSQIAIAGTLDSDVITEGEVLKVKQCKDCSKASNGNVNLIESPDGVAAQYCSSTHSCPVTRTTEESNGKACPEGQLCI